MTGISSRMGKIRRQVPHLSPLPSEVKVTGVLHSGQARILSKSCEIANSILLYAFMRDIGTVSNAVEAGQLPLVSLLGAKVLLVLHRRPQRRGNHAAGGVVSAVEAFLVPRLPP